MLARLGPGVQIGEDSPFGATHFASTMSRSEPIAALRSAIATVRGQIPKGELTRASVERLLEAAEAVCAAAESRPGDPAPEDPPRPSPRQQARARWAEIARRNAQERRRAPPGAEPD